MARRKGLPWKVLVFVVLVASAALVGAQQTRDSKDLAPTGKGWGEASQQAPDRVDHAGVNGNAGLARITCPNGICYHGGPVMGSSPTIYYIWYGNWSGSGTSHPISDSAITQGLLNTLLDGLTGSPYEHINTTYSISGTAVTGNVTNGGDVSDNYSHGTALSDAAIKAVVSAKITSGALPSDSNGVYFVLTSSDVNETSGFCTQYCGWHTHGTIAGKDIKHAFVGNPDRCPSACEWQTTSPNNDSGADGMASIIAHEQEEAISDPDLNAWYDRRGAENADKCAWTFGTTHTASNGSLYNVTLASSNFLIQRNWVNAGGGSCAMSY